MSIRTLKLPYSYRQEGNGLGGILRRLGMMAKPLLRSALKSSKPIAKRMIKDLARQGVEMGAQAVGDMVAGVPPSEALRESARTNLGQAGQRIKRSASKMAKSGYQAARKTYKRRKQSGGGKTKKKRAKSTSKKRKKGKKKTSKFNGVF